MEIIKTFYESFKRRPSMYLGKPSLERLAAFIGGIQTAEMVYEIKNRTLFPGDLGVFEQWLARKEKKYSGSVKSYELALGMTNNNDEKAFYLWMEWYEEFLNDQEITS